MSVVSIAEITNKVPQSLTCVENLHTQGGVHAALIILSGSDRDVVESTATCTTPMQGRDYLNYVRVNNTTASYENPKTSKRKEEKTKVTLNARHCEGD